MHTILFLLYTADLPQRVKRHHLTPHAYADDTHIYCHCRSYDVGDGRLYNAIIQTYMRWPSYAACLSTLTRFQRGWRQDWSPLVRIVPLPTSTPDPDWSCSCRRCLGVASHCRPGSWCLHRRRRHYEDPSHQRRQSVFCSTAPDP